MPWNFFRLAAIAGIALLVSACGTVRNTVEDGADKALMLRGHDPVAYFTQKQAVKGSPGIKADHDGLTYRFVSEEHKRQFLANPVRFVPAYRRVMPEAAALSAFWQAWFALSDGLQLGAAQAGDLLYRLLQRHLDLGDRRQRREGGTAGP